MRTLVLVVAVAVVAVGCTSGAPRQARATPGPGQGRSTAAPAGSGTVRGGRRLVVRRASWRLPRPVAREAVAGVPGRPVVVVAGGLLPGDSSSGTAYRLDLGSGRSRRLPPLPVAVHDTAAAVDRGHVLVVGGGNALEQDSVQALGPHGWTVRGHLPGPRSDLSTATVDGTTYVVGGYDGSTPALPEVVASRDGRHWTTVTRLPVPVRYAATVAVGHRLWVLGGERAGAMVDVVQVVDARAGTARVVAHLRHRVGHAMAVPLHGRILLMGGRRSTDRLTRRAWWVDPATHAVRSAGRLPYPLADAAAVPGPHGTCYLLGGETPTVTARVLEVRAR